MRKTLHHQVFFACVLFLSVLVFPSDTNGQTGEWKVWVKSSPCSGRFDWISVAKENPTGGGNFYYLANFIFPGTTCTNFGCTFQGATDIANILRSSSEFFKYCCRDYSVWENLQTGKRAVVLGKFGTASGVEGWSFVKDNLCCEEAEALAGIPGACSGTTDHQQIVNNTKCWPGSYAAWNAQANRVECYCNPGLVWNSTKTACIQPSADCSMYPGSYAAWNEQTKRMECWCPEGKIWNSTRTACVDDISKVKCWPGSYAAYNPQTKRTECYCNAGLVWNSTKTACVDPKDLVKTSDCSGYPGSYAAWNDKTQRVECYCPSGKTWNSTKTACIDVASQVKCWPGSYAAFNSQTNRTECYCNPGLVWNSTKTACIDPNELAKNTDCSSMYPGSYAAWNAQAQRVECYCPTGKVWNSTRTACVNAGTVTTGGPTWSLVSVTTTPPNPGGWKINPQAGTAHLDVYNGDKADFQWTPPPQQFDRNGITMTLNVQSHPAANSKLAALIGLGGSFNTDNPSDQSAYANSPSGPASGSRTLKCTTMYDPTEIEVRIDLMWGDIRIYYKYKRN